MKALIIVAAFAGVVATTSAFAQSTNAGAASQAAQPATAAQVASNDTAPTVAPGGWVPPYGQPVAQKTRAQVYQELVEAEKDGQLAYLNSTVYAH